MYLLVIRISWLPGQVIEKKDSFSYPKDYKLLAHVSCATALTDKVKYIHSDFSNLDCLLCLDTPPIRVWKLSAHIETDTHYSYNLSYWFHPHCFIGTLTTGLTTSVFSFNFSRGGFQVCTCCKRIFVYVL